MTTEPKNPKPNAPLREVPVAWEALEDAFENNAPEVHSYLQLATGEVIRVVDGIADPSMHARIASDAGYLRVDPVSSREQYRWMERFIATVDESDLRTKLVQSIDGKGAFRRFKDVLMSFPVDRERWFAFRSERLRACMEAWLGAHGLSAIARPQWEVPTAAEVAEETVQPSAEESATEVARSTPPPAATPTSGASTSETARARLHELVDLLAVRDLEMASAFVEFLRQRRHAPRARAKAAPEGGTESSGSGGSGGAGESES